MRRRPDQGPFVRPALASCAVVLLALTAGCGKDATPTTKASSGPSQLVPTDAPSSPTGTPATGPQISGTGYTLNLPVGWVDITRQVKASEPRIDRAGRASQATKPYTANLNVVTSASTVTDEPATQAELEKLAEGTRQEVETVVPKVHTLPLVEMGGEPAVHQEGNAQYGNTPFYLVQYAAVHGGNNYVLTFSFPTGVDEQARAAIIEPVLASFTFTK